MRLPPHTIVLLFLALLVSAGQSRAQGPMPSLPLQSGSANTTEPPKTKVKRPPPKKTSQRRKARPKPVVQEADAQKVVVNHGGTSEALPQMAPVAPQHQDSEERRKAGQLLTATDSNLKSLLGRTLTSDQQATVAQARQFMGQSRAALDAGDLAQGFNLAYKANTLSEELLKK